MGANKDMDQSERAESEPDDDDLPTPPVPPDGGWGWVIVFASLMVNVIVDGVCFTYGIFIMEYINYFGSSKAKTALIGSLIPGIYLGIGPIASALANKFGFRFVTIMGSVIASVAFFLSTFAEDIDVLLVTYGIMGGFGFGLMYLPSILIVNFYFDKRRALATGIAVAGSGIGTIAFAPLGRLLLDNYDWKGSHMIFSGIILNCAVFGALFRPLEQNKPRRRAGSAPEDLPKSGLMQLMIEEKNRQRTISTGSLDGTLITNENELIRDKRLIKKILYQKRENEETMRMSESSLATQGDNNGHLERSVSNGSAITASQEDGFRLQSGSISAGAKNKYLDRIRSESAPFGSRKRTTSNNVANPADMQPIWEKRPGFSSSRSLASLKKEVARPMYRKDIFYSGSVNNLNSSQTNMSSYAASMMSIPDLPDEDDNSCMAGCAPVKAILGEMFDFSLFRSITFVIMCTCSILAMTGFFTPFVYMTDNAMRMGSTPSSAAFLIAFLGIFNTIGRVVAGWISDQPWADCLIIHNVALVAAGVSTCFVPFMTQYWMLMCYCAVFGSGIACFISLRSIVLVELLGIENLTNSFGLLLLFQGIASLMGSPIAGMIFDYTQSYTASFMTSGALIAIAGVMVLPIRYVAAWERKKEERTLRREQQAVAEFEARMKAIDDGEDEDPEEDTSMM